MHVFVTGGTGHSGSYIIPELVAAGHEVTGLARSDTAAAAVSALGAKVRRGDLEDLDGLKEAAADSDGVIHVAHRQDLLPSGGMDAVSAAELPIMLAYGEALAGTGKPGAWSTAQPPCSTMANPGPARLLRSDQAPISHDSDNFVVVARTRRPRRMVLSRSDRNSALARSRLSEPASNRSSISVSRPLKPCEPA